VIQARIVDDSAFMRKALTKLFSSCPRSSRPLLRVRDEMVALSRLAAKNRSGSPAGGAA
jgi:hypothetical protein